MHYNVAGIVIKSHLSAKSFKEQSKFVVDYIENQENIPRILDLGCGKLRYSFELYKKCNQLILVDSPIQFSLKQQIHGEYTTIPEYLQKFDHIVCKTISEYYSGNEKVDLIFLSNVLSAIPDEIERTKLLKSINNHLNPSGKAVIVLQTTNKYFREYKYRAHAMKWLDGYIIQSKNRAAYYGCINLSRLKEICKEVNLYVDKKYQYGQLLIVEVKCQA